MVLADMIRVNRQNRSLSSEKFAQLIGVPHQVVQYLEKADPQNQEQLIAFISNALGITAHEFIAVAQHRESVSGQSEPQIETTTAPSGHQSSDAELLQGKGDGRYPALRTFLLDPTRCQTVRKALELFGSEEFGLAEQNCLLYLSTTALYHFCNENQSHFNFEKYLFTLHKELYQQFREKVSTMKLPQDRADELLSAAAGNIFFCSSMDTIAIRIVSEFAAELEHKIKINEMDFFVDIGVPFFWAVDDVLKKIEVKNSDGSLRDTINLLDVKPVDGRHPKK